MHSLIDNLIFPAPRPSYTPDTVAARLLYVPKFKIYGQRGGFISGNHRHQASENRGCTKPLSSQRPVSTVKLKTSNGELNSNLGGWQGRAQVPKLGLHNLPLSSGSMTPRLNNMGPKGFRGPVSLTDRDASVGSGLHDQVYQSASNMQQATSNRAGSHRNQMQISENNRQRSQGPAANDPFEQCQPNSPVEVKDESLVENSMQERETETTRNMRIKHTPQMRSLTGSQMATEQPNHSCIHQFVDQSNQPNQPFINNNYSTSVHLSGQKHLGNIGLMQPEELTVKKIESHPSQDVPKVKSNWLQNKLIKTDQIHQMSQSRDQVSGTAFQFSSEQGVGLSSEVLTNNIWQECIESDVSVNNLQADQQRFDQIPNRNTIFQRNVGALNQRVSTIVSSSSVETIKQNNQMVQLSSQNKSDFKNIAQLSQMHQQQTQRSISAMMNFKQIKQNQQIIQQLQTNPVLAQNMNAQTRSQLTFHKRYNSSQSPINPQSDLVNSNCQQLGQSTLQTLQQQQFNNQRNPINHNQQSLDLKKDQQSWIQNQNQQNLIELTSANLDSIQPNQIQNHRFNRLKPRDQPSQKHQGLSYMMQKVQSSRKNMHQRCKTLNEVNLKQNPIVEFANRDANYVVDAHKKDMSEFEHSNMNEQCQTRAKSYTFKFGGQSHRSGSRSGAAVQKDESHNLMFMDSMSLQNEQKKLIQHQKDSLKLSKSDFIPCLFFQGSSDYVIIHFHANGEDVGHTQQLMKKINFKLNINIVCVEYPGYGIYKEVDGLQKKQQRSKQILSDAENIYKFFRDICSVPEDKIIIMGRSIGSGPACHLAGTFKNCKALILISPIKSVKDVARENYGRIVDLLLDERFDNFEVAKLVKCPVVILHGIKDTMVPFQHSIEMLMEGFKNCEGHMFVRQDMEHNKFDYLNDILRPLKYFLRVNKIIKTFKKVPMSEYQVELMRQDGYYDKNDLCYLQHLGIASQSCYYNNFNQKFKPKEEPLKQVKSSQKQQSRAKKNIKQMTKDKEQIDGCEPECRSGNDRQMIEELQQDQPPLFEDNQMASKSNSSKMSEDREGIHENELEARLTKLQKKFEQQFTAIYNENALKTKNSNGADNDNELKNIKDTKFPFDMKLEQDKLRESLRASLKTLDLQTSESFVASSIVINDEFKAADEQSQMAQRIEQAKANQPKQEMSTLNKKLMQSDINCPPASIGLQNQMRLQNYMTQDQQQVSDGVNPRFLTRTYLTSKRPSQDLLSDYSKQSYINQDDEFVYKMSKQRNTPFGQQIKERQIFHPHKQVMDYLNSIYSINELQQRMMCQSSVKVSEQFFKAPVSQIKDIQEHVECSLKAVTDQQKQNQVKQKMKPPMINRFIVSQMRQTYDTLKEKQLSQQSSKQQSMNNSVHTVPDSIQNHRVNQFHDSVQAHPHSKVSVVLPQKDIQKQHAVQSKKLELHKLDNDDSQLQNTDMDNQTTFTPDNFRSANSLNLSCDSNQNEIQNERVCSQLTNLDQLNSLQRNCPISSLQERVTFGESHQIHETCQNIIDSHKLIQSLQQDSEATVDLKSHLQDQQKSSEQEVDLQNQVSEFGDNQISNIEVVEANQQEPKHERKVRKTKNYFDQLISIQAKYSTKQAQVMVPDSVKSKVRSPVERAEKTKRLRMKQKSLFSLNGILDHSKQSSVKSGHKLNGQKKLTNKVNKHQSKKNSIYKMSQPQNQASTSSTSKLQLLKQISIDTNIERKHKISQKGSKKAKDRKDESQFQQIVRSTTPSNVKEKSHFVEKRSFTPTSITNQSKVSSRGNLTKVSGPTLGMGKRNTNPVSIQSTPKKSNKNVNIINKGSKNDKMSHKLIKKNLDQSPAILKSRQQPIDGSSKQYRNWFVQPPQSSTIKSSPQIEQMSKESSMAEAQKLIIQQIKKSPKIIQRAGGLNMTEEISLRSKQSQRVNQSDDQTILGSPRIISMESANSQKQQPMSLPSVAKKDHYLKFGYSKANNYVFNQSQNSLQSNSQAQGNTINSLTHQDLTNGQTNNSSHIKQTSQYFSQLSSQNNDLMEPKAPKPLQLNLEEIVSSPDLQLFEKYFSKLNVDLNLGTKKSNNKPQQATVSKANQDRQLIVGLPQRTKTSKNQQGSQETSAYRLPPSKGAPSRFYKELARVPSQLKVKTGLPTPRSNHHLTPRESNFKVATGISVQELSDSQIEYRIQNHKQKVARLRNQVKAKQ